MAPDEGRARPRIGVGVIVRRGERVLLGHRVHAHGSGTWQFPGGHLEYGEAIEDCAHREVLEETGLDVEIERLGPFTNDVFADEGRHYVTLYVLARSEIGDPIPQEPDKCDRWDWFDWEALPSPLFLPIRNLIASGWENPPGGLGSSGSDVA